MEMWDLLARHHWRAVDKFIEGLLDRMDLTDLERNVVGVAVRREVEEGLVPGLVAVQSLLHAANAETLGRELPEWLDRVSSVIPGDAGFLAEMGRQLDPHGAVLLDENSGAGFGKSEVRRVFEAHLWEMAPCVSRGAGSVT